MFTNEIRKIKKAYEDGDAFNAASSLDKKIVAVIEDYLDKNDENLPSDLYVLRKVSGSRRVWSYMTRPILYSIGLGDPMHLETEKTIAVVNEIVELKITKIGNLRLLCSDKFKKFIFENMLNARKEYLAYFSEKTDDDAKNIVKGIRLQIEEINKALQSVA